MKLLWIFFVLQFQIKKPYFEICDGFLTEIPADRTQTEEGQLWTSGEPLDLMIVGDAAVETAVKSTMLTFQLRICFRRSGKITQSRVPEIKNKVQTDRERQQEWTSSRRPSKHWSSTLFFSFNSNIYTAEQLAGPAPFPRLQHRWLGRRQRGGGGGELTQPSSVNHMFGWGGAHWSRRLAAGGAFSTWPAGF